MTQSPNNIERFERAFGPNQAAHKCHMISMTNEYLHKFDDRPLSQKVGFSMSVWSAVQARVAQTFGESAMQELMSDVFCQLDIIKMLSEIDFAESAEDNMVYVLNVEEGQSFEAADNVVKFETAAL